jgi:pyrroloquinoline quinone biosynthesis protein D
MSPESIPTFPRGVKYHFNAAREAWVLLAPERAFLPDETGQMILSAVDGLRSVREIANDIATLFDAPVAVVEADILEMLQDLALRGVVQDKGTAA